jgi:uncharacterized lipoprotein YddW (UPF0748 family)
VWVAAVAAAAVLVLGLAGRVAAQDAAPLEQYRAFWVDTFNTRLNSPADVATVIARATQAGANALVVQVRRRGDAWYLDSLEPLPDNVPIERDFDPLRELIDRAHERGLEVHAFVIVGAIWNSLTPPTDPNHVFNRHGLDPATGRPFEGRANWLTRTLLADGTATSVGGYRFGNEFWIDLGHPDAADYTLQVLLRLLAAYDIDGLHLDRIRYPEIAVSGQTPSTGTSVGYNPTSVERFNRAMGRPADAVPEPGDAAWSQWRRDQVTAFVRRVYLSVMAVRPRVKVSAAVVTFGAGPAEEAAWVRMEPYWRVYQDWRAWQEEGIVDLMLPMVYKTQHSATSRQAFNAWTTFVAGQQHARHAVVGLGAYLNSLEGTLQQVREAVAPRAEGPAARGVAFFSMAATNAPVLANPLAIPAGRDTPLRTFDDFAAALLTGRTAGGQWLEPQAGFPGGVFETGAVVPAMPWKTEPAAGHLLGTLRAPDGAPIDTATVIVGRADEGEAPLEGPTGRLSAAVETDGNGVYGAVDLAPGRYVLMITPRGSGTLRSACTVEVTPGGVARLDLVVDGLSPTLAQCVAAEPSRYR